MDDITIGVTEFVNNILVSAQPNDQIIDIAVTETVETVLLDVSTTVQEVTVTATQNVIVENITVDYVNNENNIDINVTDGTQDVTLNVTPTLVEINILRSGGEVNILQFNTLADFPATGSIDYFYLAKDTNKLYRWTGSAYAEISATANARWGQIIGTLSNQTDLQNALNLKAPINSPTFTGTVSGITKAMVGLGAVDNTSDLDKPISTATQTALNNKQPLDGDLTSIAALSGTFGLLKKTANNSYTIDTNTYLTGITSSDVTTALGYTPENVANKGANNGYASLGGDGKVPSSQLPSYVDDVIEVSSFGTLPTTGETGKIYITLDTNKIYRWSGSVYVEVSSSAAVWGGITGTLSNQTDLQTALDAKQDDLNGTGFVKASGTTISYDNTTYYPASNPNGYTSNVGTVTSVALTVPSAFSVSGSPITSSGTLAITGAGTTAQYVRGDGTLATMPDISGFVPYTGATGNVNLGSNNITAGIAIVNQVKAVGSGGLSINSNNGTQIAILGGGGGANMTLYGGLSGTSISLSSSLTASSIVKSGGTSSQFLKADGSVDSNTYLTSASLSGYVDTTGNQSIAGNKYFTGFGLFDNTIFIKQDSSVSFLTGYNSIDSDATGIIFSLPAGNMAKFVLTSLTASRDYTLPNTSGTIALTSDIPSLAGYVATTGTQSIGGTKTFTSYTLFDQDIYLKHDGTLSGFPGYSTIAANATSIIFGLPSLVSVANFDISGLTAQRYYNLPDANGIIALTSQLHNAVTIGTANGLSLSTQVLSLALASTSTTGALSSTDWNTFNNKASTASLANYLPLSGGTISTSSSSDALRVLNGGTGYALYVQSNAFFQGDAGFQSVGTNAMVKTNSSRNLVAAVAGTDYVVPSALSAYLPLTGGTLTGALTMALGGNPRLTLQDTDSGSGNVGILFKEATNDKWTLASVGGAFQFFNEATSSNALWITSTNNVGIGTTAPNTRLHTTGSFTVNDIIYLQRSSSSLYLPIANYWNGSGSPLAGTKGDILAIGNAGGDGLVFVNGNTERMRITSGGNVLIGTTSDGGFRLNVSGTGFFGSFIKANSSFSSYTQDGLFSANATYSAIITPGGNERIRFGYYDYGGGQYYGRIGFQANTNWSLGTIDSAGNDFSIGTGAAGQAFRINSNGNVYVNRSTGDGKFNVDGAVYLYNFSTGAGTNAVKYNASTGLLSYDTSSIRYKDNVRDSIYGLADILKLKSVMFEYKQEKNTDVGLIAEEVYKVIPELVQLDQDKNPNAVSYDRLVSVLIKGMQELKAELDILKNK